jgi:hypothetical protein
MFFLQYIKEEESINNAFAEFGSFGHLILEKYLKKELAIFDLSKYYEENFNKEVRIPFPPNKYKDLRESYYEAGKRYFEEFEEELLEELLLELLEKLLEELLEELFEELLSELIELLEELE